MSSIERTLPESLEEATREYKSGLTSPDNLTHFMCRFWTEAGQRIGKEYVVSDFSQTSQEIQERAKNGQMAIFVPDGVSLTDLGKMFPEMDSRVVAEGNSVENKISGSGWLWIESSIDSPNKNTSEEQLKDIFKKVDRQGQSLRTYIVGSQISKLLTGKYFDEGSNWSRLLNSSVGDNMVLCPRFLSNGRLKINSILRSWLKVWDLGGRSEEVVKTH